MPLSRSEYYGYIRSPAWAEKKRQYYASKMYKTLKSRNNGWICYCCFANDKPLDLHHRTYKRLGEENIAVDLVPVCRDCHEKIHKLHKSTKISLWSATKKIRKPAKRKEKIAKRKKARPQRILRKRKKLIKDLQEKI
jgi:hypothetical protein